jgi:hypothetical protein
MNNNTTYEEEDTFVEEKGAVRKVRPLVIHIQLTITNQHADAAARSARARQDFFYSPHMHARSLQRLLHYHLKKI